MAQDDPIKVGDFVDKISRPELDAREVAYVDHESGMLAILINGKPVGPLDLNDYRKTR